jgi:DNA-binding response OmpR family regulator
VIQIAVISSDESLARSLPDFEVSFVEPPRPSGQDPSRNADVVLLDVRDPGRIGLIAELARRGRAVVALRGRSHHESPLRYLDAGADDCVSTEMEPAELAARIRAVVRRNPKTAETSVFDEPASDREHIYREIPDDPLTAEEFHFAELSVLTGRHEVWRGDDPVNLTPTEFSLLTELAQHANEVVPHRKLTAAVWGAEGLTSRRHLRVHIRHLREKLEVEPGSPALVITEKGQGYRLCVTEVKAA